MMRPVAWLRALTRRLATLPRRAGFGGVVAILLLVVVVRVRGHDTVDFNEDVRPILNNKCISCHGGVKRSAGFGVLFREDALVPGESGRPGIVPGNPNASEMIRRITHADPAQRMPSDADPLSDGEIRILRRWIAQGAEWGDHWAYQKPVERPPPEVSDVSWPRSGIDHFVLARLEAERLAPAPAASCATLARRVSLDLVGLPPTAESVDRLCADPSDDAYASFVDDLLASPRFGEHWASTWLDLARYADTKGYEKDEHREIWPYRDWVIRALNEDMPFDRFTIEQLAGDLLPRATDEQVLATAYHRNTMTNDEDGTDDEEFRIAAVLDRVNTTMEVWQGITMGCVQCHSHPYDPIRHEEYFEVFAFFDNTVDGDRKNDSPRMPLYAPEQRDRVARLLSQLQTLGMNTAPEAEALALRVEQVVHPLGWMPAADFVESEGITSTGDFISPLDDGGWARYEGIALDGVAAIDLGYSGRNGAVEIRQGRADGPLLGRAELPDRPPTRPAGGLSLSPTVRVPIAPTSGRHDLVIVLRADRIAAFRVTSLAPRPAMADAVAESSGEIDRLVTELVAVPPETEVPVLRDRPADRARITQLFERGNWMVRSDTVQPGVPGVLPALPDDAPNNRLALARWLVDEENPLTGRVIANRFWAGLFGTGIVETLNDFGTQGEPPSHPDLLDHLAIRFSRDHGWSVKSLLRELVLSSTYRQSSQVTPDLLERDPHNRLLARGPRVRLSAEQVRDQALAVAGLLSDRMYGPGVMPPQPPGVWNSPYNSREWVTSQGEDRYRRGVYTYWKRTAPYPSMVTFDSPSREFCVSQRNMTNTPLQALVTLNDPVYVEAAQALARRMAGSGGDLDRQIRLGYREALQRDPDAETLDRLRQLYMNVTASYIEEPGLLEEAITPYAPYDSRASGAGGYVSAVNAAPSGIHPIFSEALPAEPIHVAALTTVASVIMNLDVFLTKD